MSSARTSTRSRSTAAMTIVGGPLLDVDAVAGALGVTTRHIRRLVAERRIPCLKVGKFVRFDPGELDVWLDQQRMAPSSPCRVAPHPGGSVVGTPGGLELCGHECGRWGPAGVRLPIRILSLGVLP
jgi:excisionase family DNA binding protein